MNYTQSIGNVVELQCISKFIELGYECSIPYGNNAKYDFVVDINGKFLRIQCKSATRVKKKNGELDDAFSISTVSQTTNTQKTTKHRYTLEQIDYFATYYNNKVYLIPVQECSTSKTLRFSPPNNNNSYNHAEDYEIEKIISFSEELLQSKTEFVERTKSNIVNKEDYCKECGKEITENTKTGLCASCFKKTQRKVDRPNREELKNLIRTKSFVEIGKMYGVSDRSITKWCIAESLPNLRSTIKSISDEDWIKI